jgi:hypothetical protein
LTIAAFNGNGWHVAIGTRQWDAVATAFTEGIDKKVQDLSSFFHLVGTLLAEKLVQGIGTWRVAWIQVDVFLNFLKAWTVGNRAGNVVNFATIIELAIGQNVIEFANLAKAEWNGKMGTVAIVGRLFLVQCRMTGIHARGGRNEQYW